MAIVIPLGRSTQWVRHEVLDGSCLSLSLPAQSTSKMMIELPRQGDIRLEVTVGEGASCELLTVQEHGTGTVHAEGRIAAGGALHWRPITIGGSVRHEINSTCIGDGARSEASWIVVASSGNHPQAIIRNIFHARNGGGEVAMRAVALAKARVLLDGRIEIGEGGGGTQTYLTQEALMLDASATIDAIPGLEIKTNDVKASHSATVSRVNPDDVFYAASRGITPDLARQMLVEGFFRKLLEGVHDAPMMETLLARVIAAASEVHAL